MKNPFKIICVLLFSPFVLLANNVDEGRLIFKQNCSSCHRLESKLVGPPLKGITEKRSKKWIMSFVKSSQTLIKSGDADAVALFNENNQTVMPDHQQLSDSDIEKVLDFIVSESQNIEKNKALSKPNFIMPEVKHPSYLPITFKNYFIWIAFFLFFALILFVFWALVVAESTIHIEDHWKEEIEENS